MTFCSFTYSSSSVNEWTHLNHLYNHLYYVSENEKNCVEKNVSTPGISICFETYLYNIGNYSSCPWQFPASSQLAPHRRPSMGDEEEEQDSTAEGQSEKIKKPKKVYCYISPKVKNFWINCFMKVVMFFNI